MVDLRSTTSTIVVGTCSSVATSSGGVASARSVVAAAGVRAGTVTVGVTSAETAAATLSVEAGAASGVVGKLREVGIVASSVKFCPGNPVDCGGESRGVICV